MIGTDTMLRIIAANIGNIPTRNKGKLGKCYEVPCSFDTETSSFYDKNGEKVGLVYAWMFGFANTVCLGRSIWEFQRFIENLNDVLASVTRVTGSLTLWTHNLPYDFQFIRKLFNFSGSFLVGPREVLYAKTGNVIFRDSLIMSGGRSLALIGKELRNHDVKKMVGDLDYSLIRTPITPLTEKELGYCENDIRVLQAYVYEKMEADGAMSKIPLTNTGYVRQDLKDSCFSDWTAYSAMMDDLTITPDCYMSLRKAQMGGFTHAARKMVGKVLENVGSYDICSSYPTVMILDEFPMGPGQLVSSEYAQEHLEELMNDWCMCFEIKWTNVVPKLGFEFIISESKCNKATLTGAVVTNGRIMCASYLETFVTEHDYRAYHRFYDVDKEEIGPCYLFRKGKLPKHIVLPIVNYYWKKTALKGVKGQEREYMISKNMLNSVYGCSCMNPVRDEYSYEDEAGFLRNGVPIWDFENRKDVDYVAAVEEYDDNPRRFLYYPWGIWVTALARRNLFRMLEEIGPDYVYADTDSLKMLNWEKHAYKFEMYNKEILEKIQKAARYYEFPPEKLYPKSPDGEEHPIGVFEFEGVYKRFKTLGAKRYLVEDEHGLKMTVSGLNKAKGCKYLEETGKPFEAFDDNLVIPADKSGRQTSTYIDERRTGTVRDYNGIEYEYDVPSCVHIEPSEYSMSVDDDLKQMLLALTGARRGDG